MHELSITTKLLNSALSTLEQNHGSRIFSINLEIGAMNDCEDKWLFKYWDQLTEGTAAKGAALNITHKPFVFKCKNCGFEFEFDPKTTVNCFCTMCQSSELTMISGRQFDITSMEIE
ncbi:MAG: hydrogenase maturation nickel metallochaperone HypA [Pseudobutyrivibrio sp.]|nr:hydrogenase maturation nickel metallochaperone HypA [Pseudobutyrivibrio sp.]